MSTTRGTKTYRAKQNFDEITKTTTKQCNLQCRAGVLINTNGQCYCICQEFYRFNGNTCVLSKPRSKNAHISTRTIM